MKLITLQFVVTEDERAHAERAIQEALEVALADLPLFGWSTAPVRPRHIRWRTRYEEEPRGAPLPEPLTRHS
jgi:hypothetical protein